MANYQFESQQNYFSSLQTSNGFTSTWSIYDVHNIDDLSLHEGLTMTYHDNFVEPAEVSLPKGRLTWLQLWRAADECIRRSGDTTHHFIEGFRKNGGMLELITGS